MARDAVGRLYLWPGGALLVGPRGTFERHVHHAVQITVPLEGTLTIRRAGGRARTAKLALIAPDLDHEVTSAAPILTILLDPHGARGHALALRARAPLAAERAMLAAVPPLLASLPASAAEARAWIDRLLAPLALVPRAAELHPAAVAVMRAAEARLDRSVGLEELADEVGVSVSRLTHVFGRDVGMPFRRWLLWIRALRATKALLAGRDLGAAAHDAGFSDAAHFSRTVRRMFGQPPSALLRGVELVDDGFGAAPLTSPPQPVRSSGARGRAPRSRP